MGRGRARLPGARRGGAWGHPDRKETSRYLTLGFPIAIYRQQLQRGGGTHWHEFFELGFVSRGEGTHVLNGGLAPLRRGSMFLLTPGDVHDVLPASGGTLDLFDVVFLSEALAPELAQGLFAEPRPHSADVEGPAADRIDDELHRMWTESSERLHGHQLVIRGVLERVLVDLARLLRKADPGAPPRREGERGDVERRALAYVHTHFRGPISLHDVARHVSLSPSYFSERFSASVGQPFRSYLQKLRLRFAISLLRASDLPVTEVCHAAGFSTLGHFERVFKQHVGIAPQSFRKQRS